MRCRGETPARAGDGPPSEASASASSTRSSAASPMACAATCQPARWASMMERRRTTGSSSNPPPISPPGPVVAAVPPSPDPSTQIFMAPSDSQGSPNPVRTPRSRPLTMRSSGWPDSGWNSWSWAIRWARARNRPVSRASWYAANSTGEWSMPGQPIPASVKLVIPSARYCEVARSIAAANSSIDEGPTWSFTTSVAEPEADDPLLGLQSLGVGGHGIEGGVDPVELAQPQVDQSHAERGRVAVGVVEAGGDGGPVEIDHGRRGVPVQV